MIFKLLLAMVLSPILWFAGLFMAFGHGVVPGLICLVAEPCPAVVGIIHFVWQVDLIKVILK